MRNILFSGLALLALVGAVAPVSPAAAQQTGGVSVDRRNGADAGNDKGGFGHWNDLNRDRDGRNRGDDRSHDYRKDRHDLGEAGRGDGNYRNSDWGYYRNKENGSHQGYGNDGGYGGGPIRIRPL
jgi:hypothetical protein